MTNNNDLLVIQKVLGGDVHAYATLVDLYKDKAVSLAYHVLLNREDAQEAAQDAFIKAYSALNTFKATAKFTTWLYRIIVNTALNKKKLKRYDTVSIDQTLHETIVISDDAFPVLKNANKKHIQAALQAISYNERICISLYYLEELSVEEIHGITCISPSNIKVLLHRGRKSLYASLQLLLKNEITDLI